MRCRGQRRGAAWPGQPPAAQLHGERRGARKQACRASVLSARRWQGIAKEGWLQGQKPNAAAQPCSNCHAAWLPARLHACQSGTLPCACHPLLQRAGRQVCPLTSQVHLAKAHSALKVAHAVHTLHLHLAVTLQYRTGRRNAGQSLAALSLCLHPESRDQAAARQGRRIEGILSMAGQNNGGTQLQPQSRAEVRLASRETRS